MAVGQAPADFALESAGLTRLKATAAKDQSAAIDGASKQFEALFIQEMLKSMRSATPKSGLLESKATDLYTSLYDQQLAQNMSGKGIGLAESISKEMRSKGLIDGSVDEYSESLFAGIPVGKPRLLTSADAIANKSADGVLAPKINGGVEQVGKEGVEGTSFLRQITIPARNIAKRSGIPSELMIAQAILETGWGKHQIKTDQGMPSNNLFGIKAGAHWKGRTASVTTTEFVNGEPVKREERFRVYSSVQESMSDYARLISGASRYKNVMAAPTPEAAAYALQAGGYATDPAYATKLIGVMDSVEKRSLAVASPSRGDRPNIFGYGPGTAFMK